MPNNTFNTKYRGQVVCSVLLYLRGRSLFKDRDILRRINLILNSLHPKDTVAMRKPSPLDSRIASVQRSHEGYLCQSFFCLFSRAKRPRASVLRINGAMSSSPHDSRYSTFLAVDNELSDIKVAGQGKI